MLCHDRPTGYFFPKGMTLRLFLLPLWVSSQLNIRKLGLPEIISFLVKLRALILILFFQDGTLSVLKQNLQCCGHVSPNIPRL